MPNYLQGFYKPQNPKKYIGDANDIVYRSSWELQALKWCDLNPDILKYSSEDIIVPYTTWLDGHKKVHRYFVDLYLEFASGRKMLIEIKPKKQLMKPRPTKGKRKQKLVEERITYETNKAKFQAAEKFAAKRGWVFQVWSEDVLKSLGFTII